MRFLIWLLCLMPLAAWAGPPYLTDDPDPVDYRTFEIIPAFSLDRASDGEEIAGPVADFNYGIAPDMHLNIGPGFVRTLPADAPSQAGLGDTRVALKWRFHHESDDSPEIAIYPAIELPTGNSERGLGNGQAWYQFPIWFEKNWSGGWSSYWGAGWTLNRAAGQRDYFYGGWQFQKQLTGRWNLGAEVYSQGASGTDAAGWTALNLGGAYQLAEHAAIIFSFGHSFAGASQALGYLGIDLTW
ncbi:MAG TPA: transporter [Gammaproteobacteria bacterium]|nr:transporter [Gammaproteobacteria bacterium]